MATPAPKGKDIFLSYGRNPEVDAFVEELKKGLEQAGFSVWMDRSDIPAGSDWNEEIEAGVSDCKAFVAVVTNKYMKSNNCQNELHFALGKKKKIFPIIYEDIKDESANDKLEHRMGRFNWLYKSRLDYPVLKDELIKGLTKAIGLESTDGPDQTAEATSSQPPSSASSSSQDGLLGIDDSGHVLDVLKKHNFTTADWRILCGRLGLSHNSMSMIENNNVRNVERQLDEGISCWLKGNIVQGKGYKKPSWKVLVEALRGMGENAVAEGIEKEKKI